MSEHPPTVTGHDSSLADMRQDYRQAELDESTLAADPFDQFDLWFKQACESGVIEPNAMSLATSTPAGETSIRTVLCKGVDGEGLLFFTNLESTKGRQLAENPNVSAVFPWLKLERQVVVNGRAHKLTSGEVLKYFVTRPFDSRIAAWTSQQSSVVTTRKLLEMKFAELKQKFSHGEVPVPSFWGGFRIIPRTIEFWQGRPNRMHDRFLYSRNTEASWKIERLAP